MKDPTDDRTIEMNLEKAMNTFSRFTRAASQIDEKEVVIHAGSKKEAVNEPFVLLFYESLTELVIENKLSISDIKVMLAICGIARFGNLVSMSQKGLADMIGIDKAVVSRSIKKLTAECVLLKSDLGLFINPTLIVKGGLSKIEPELWDTALKQGAVSPVKSVSKKQQRNLDL